MLKLQGIRRCPIEGPVFFTSDDHRMKLLLFTLLFHSYIMVDLTKWKQCKDSGFCARQRALSDLVDIATGDQSIESKKLKNDMIWTATDFKVTNSIKGKLKMESLEEIFDFEFLFSSDFIRFQMLPTTQTRYQTGFSIQDLEYAKVTEYQETENMLVAEHNGMRLEVQKMPFNFTIFKNSVKIVSFNRRGYLYYETFGKGKGPAFAQSMNETLMTIQNPDAPAIKDEKQETPIELLKKQLNTNLGDEHFGGNTDSKPNGPTSLGFDVTFENAVHLYGLPEHSSAFNLKSTRGKEKSYDEPFRLYNVDIFEHLNDSPMAMYGNVPFIMSHKKGQSSAVLMLNSAEMWVDIERIDILDQDKKSGSSHWMVESGIIDLFVFAGPTQQDIFNSYTKLTGRPQLPQEFALGHHSCRWNYNDEKDCLQVDDGFDKHEIPYDVLWLDIEHTNEKRYFTFDKIKFPNPEQLQKTIADKGRKMVTIIDPHIKKDSGYYVSQKASDLDIFVKTKDLGVLDGECWPGQSNWIDYTNSKARDYWAEQFEYQNYQGSTPTLYTWNDMNEPSVFSGPEVTMPKDSIHFNGVEHRDVHNVYGMLLVTIVNSIGVLLKGS